MEYLVLGRGISPANDDICDVNQDGGPCTPVCPNNLSNPGGPGDEICDVCGLM